MCATVQCGAGRLGTFGNKGGVARDIGIVGIIISIFITISIVTNIISMAVIINIVSVIIIIAIMLAMVMSNCG